MANRVNAKQQRQAAAAAAAAQAARERRSRTIKIVAGVAVLVLAVVGGIVVPDATHGGRRSRRSWPAGRPPSSFDDGIAVGEAEAPVVEIYLDFLCSHCADLEERVGDAVADLAVDGEAKFVIHPITLIDPTESARSAAAFGCAAGTIRCSASRRRCSRTLVAASPPSDSWRSPPRSVSTTRRSSSASRRSPKRTGRGGETLRRLSAG